MLLAQAPAGLVESINQQLLNTELDKHLTIVAGSLDTETRKLRYVVGAHQPSPILIVDGNAQYLPGKASLQESFKMPLGRLRRYSCQKNLHWCFFGWGF